MTFVQPHYKTLLPIYIAFEHIFMLAFVIEYFECGLQNAYRRLQQ